MPQHEIYFGWKIVFYVHDHGPVHFHAKKAEHVIKVILCDFPKNQLESPIIKLIQGKVSPADKRLLIDYAKQRYNELLEVWNGYHN